MPDGEAKSREDFIQFFRESQVNQEPFMSAVIFILTMSPPYLAHLSALGEPSITVTIRSYISLFHPGQTPHKHTASHGPMQNLKTNLLEPLTYL